jgi:broad specificity phosphatase PhoE
MSKKSSVWLYRHANRLDQEDPNWIFSKDGLNYVYDTPLSLSGFETAQRMGNFIWDNEKDKLIKYDTLDGLKIFSSPFHRCLQTSTTIAETIETHWIKAKNIENDKDHHIKICVEFGLAEDIPDRSFDFKTLSRNKKRELIANELNPLVEPHIIERIDIDYNRTQILGPEDRLTCASIEEYHERVSKVYGELANSGHHTILISGHLDETFVGYRKLGNQNATKRYQYGVMANLINNNDNMTVRYPIWEHHKDYLSSSL